MSTKKNFQTSAKLRALTSLACGLLIVYILCGFVALNSPEKVIVFYIVSQLTYLVQSWYSIFNTPVSIIEKKALEEDGGNPFVYSLIGLSIAASFLALLGLMVAKNSNQLHINGSAFLTMATLELVLSWLTVHTAFVYHYAKLYYGSTAMQKALTFPDPEKPDYLDFAYFSFGIGCTFQVADISINTKKMRRVVLMHSIISFVINTYAVAMSVNIFADLGK